MVFICRWFVNGIIFKFLVYKVLDKMLLAYLYGNKKMLFVPNSMSINHKNNILLTKSVFSQYTHKQKPYNIDIK